ncbi:hypothetical protein [Pinirhizobacter soli]|uniref:hypothetical protein n=1 Tax=Pinirhizobacter soli TaxID=2786953 RepID=UPI00202A442D
MVAAWFAATGMPVPVHAQSNFSGQVAVGSQLVDRGLAITSARPVVQGAVNWATPDGWSVGASAGALMGSPGNIADWLVQGSRAWVVSTDWQVQASGIYYRYTRSGSSRVYTRAEAGMAWIYRDTLTLSLSAVRALHSPDHEVRPGADVDFRWPLPWNLSFSAGAGVSQALVLVGGYYAHGAWVRYPRPRLEAPTYRYGHVGLAWAHGRWRVGVERVATDLGDRAREANLDAAPWIGTVSLSF